MHATHDVSILGTAFTAAIRRILPQTSRRDLGPVTISPAGVGYVRLASLTAHEDVPAEGAWLGAVATSGRFLRSLVATAKPAVVRLVFFGAVLTVNGTSVTAAAKGPRRVEPLPSPAPPGWAETPLGAAAGRRTAG